MISFFFLDHMIGPGRKAGTFVMSGSGAMSPNLVIGNTYTRNLKKNQLGGVIFGCANNTIKECLFKQLFGLSFAFQLHLFLCICSFIVILVLFFCFVLFINKMTPQHLHHNLYQTSFYELILLWCSLLYAFVIHIEIDAITVM